MWLFVHVKTQSIVNAGSNPGKGQTKKCVSMKNMTPSPFADWDSIDDSLCGTVVHETKSHYISHSFFTSFSPINDLADSK